MKHICGQRNDLPLVCVIILLQRNEKEEVNFPIAPNLSEMSDGYLEIIEEIKKKIQKQRISVVMNANASMICFYWNIGKAILVKQE